MSSSQIPSINWQCWEISSIPYSMCFGSDSHLLPRRTVIFIMRVSIGQCQQTAWVWKAESPTISLLLLLLVQFPSRGGWGGRLSLLLPRFFQLNATWHELPVFTEENSLDLCREIIVVTAGYLCVFCFWQEVNFSLVIQLAKRHLMSHLYHWVEPEWYINCFFEKACRTVCLTMFLIFIYLFIIFKPKAPK